MNLLVQNLDGDVVRFRLVNAIHPFGPQTYSKRLHAKNFIYLSQLSHPTGDFISCKERPPATRNAFMCDFGNQGIWFFLSYQKLGPGLISTQFPAGVQTPAWV